MPLRDVIIVQRLYIYTGIDSIYTSQGYDWVHHWMWVYNINFIHKLRGSFVPVESGLWDHSRALHVGSKHIYLMSTKTLCPTEAWVQQREKKGIKNIVPCGTAGRKTQQGHYFSPCGKRCLRWEKDIRISSEKSMLHQTGISGMPASGLPQPFLLDILSWFNDVFLSVFTFFSYWKPPWEENTVQLRTLHWKTPTGLLLPFLLHVVRT